MKYYQSNDQYYAITDTQRIFCVLPHLFEVPELPEGSKQLNESDCYDLEFIGIPSDIYIDKDKSPAELWELYFRYQTPIDFVKNKNLSEVFDNYLKECEQFMSSGGRKWLVDKFIEYINS